MATTKHSANPFPGLRPFEAHETYLFFGRDGQSEELLGKLKRSRFLAVVGTSGSGKSSLVRAGLLPALQGGLMAGAGSGWRIALLRPGNDPIGNLAQALMAADVLGGDDGQDEEIRIAVTETILRRSSLGLIDVFQRARASANQEGQPLLGEHENLLVVVDQFEELFRFKQRLEAEPAEAAAAFVKLLLESTIQKEKPNKERRTGEIYIVLTMRSDFLGDCAQFWGLPEAINNGQYLIPRMMRDERRQAITGPIAVGRGEIDGPLVNQLLNDVGDNPDQLPILQHALMRTWDYWMRHRPNGEPIRIADYQKIGGMAEALSRHADEAYDELSEPQKEIAERLFKCLTEKGLDNREIRRPVELKTICAEIEAAQEAVIPVIESFRTKGRSFLMPPADKPLDARSLIDISHESLIRNWQRLQTWVNEEAQSARLYKRLAQTAELYNDSKERLLQDPALSVALNWRDENKPNKDWAQRYHPEYDNAMAFLEESRVNRDKEAADREQQLKIQLEQAQTLAEQKQLLIDSARQRAEDQARSARRLRWLVIAMAVLLMLSVVAAASAVRQKSRANEATRIALVAKQTAEELQQQASERADLAEQQQHIIDIERANAQTAALDALEAQTKAEEQARIARQQRQRAEEQVRLATKLKNLGQWYQDGFSRIAGSMGGETGDPEEIFRKLLMNFNNILKYYKENKNRPAELATLQVISALYADMEPGKAIGYDRQMADYLIDKGDYQAAVKALFRVRDYYLVKPTPTPENKAQADKAFEKVVEVYRKFDPAQGFSTLVSEAKYGSNNDKAGRARYYDQAFALLPSIPITNEMIDGLMSMGYFYATSGAPAKADGCFDKALQVYRDARNRSEEIDLLERIGRTLLNSKSPEAAQVADRYYDQVLKFIETDDEKGLTRLLEIGDNYYLAKRQEKTEAYYELAIQAYNKKGERDKEIATLMRLGTLYANHADAERAAASYDRAVAISRETGDRAKEIATLLAIADTTRNSFTGGENNQVLPRLTEAYYNRAVQVHHDGGDRDAEAATLVSIAQKYQVDSPEASRYDERAVQLYQQAHNAQKEAALYADIADRYVTRNHEKMFEYYNRAITSFKASGDHLGEGETCWKLGRYYASASKGKAADYFNRALSLLPEALPALAVGKDRQKEADTLYSIGYAYDYFDDKAKVLDYYKRALPLYEGLPSHTDSYNRSYTIRNRIEELSGTLKEPK